MSDNGEKTADTGDQTQPAVRNWWGGVSGTNEAPAPHQYPVTGMMKGLADQSPRVRDILLWCSRAGMTYQQALEFLVVSCVMQVDWMHDHIQGKLVSAGEQEHLPPFHPLFPKEGG